MSDLIGLTNLTITSASGEGLSGLRVAAWLVRCDGTRATNVIYSSRESMRDSFLGQAPEVCSVGGPLSHYKYQPLYSKTSAADGTVKFGNVQFSSAPPGCYRFRFSYYLNDQHNSTNSAATKNIYNASLDDPLRSSAVVSEVASAPFMLRHPVAFMELVEKVRVLWALDPKS
jgi:hypothetical protein